MGMGYTPFFPPFPPFIGHCVKAPYAKMAKADKLES